MSGAAITKLRVALIEAPLETPIVAPFGTVTTRRNILVRIETKDGSWGIGETWANFPPWGCRERVDILTNVVRPLVVGQSLDDPARLYRIAAESMRSLANQLGAAGPFQQALSGADIAVWDACARRAGLPLADFIRGGAAPREVGVYATNLPYRRPEAIEDMADKGHTRFKFRVPAQGDVLVRVMQQARAIAGERALMADVTQSYTLDALRPLAEGLAALSLEWLEEPFLVDDPEAYRAWRDLPVRPPVSLGENTYRLGGFQRLLDDISPDVLQPDITKTAGISEGRAICRAIVDAGKKACLHMYGGPVGTYASAHLSAAIEGMSWLEFDSQPNPLFERLLRNEPVIRAGKLQLPLGLGLGDDLIHDSVFEATEVD
jgi:L-alanine-DL-glutamate epimerase-like enolase superfamily enzyme